MNTSFENAVCPRCGDVAQPVVGKTKESCYPAVAVGRGYLRCKGCDLMALRPIPTSQDITKWYREGYRDGTEPSASYLAASKQYASRRVGFLRKHATLPAEGHVLEIGCSTGNFLAGFQELFPGWQITGIELHEGFSRYAASLLGGHVISAPIEDCSFDQNFELITMFGVLEHIVDLESVLSSIHTGLKKGGLLYVEVPNIDVWWYKFRPSDLIYDNLKYLHIWGFTSRSLRSIVEQAGFSIVHASTHSNEFPLPWQIKERACSPPINDGSSGDTSRLTRLLAQAYRMGGHFLTPVDRLLGGFNLSLIART